MEGQSHPSPDRVIVSRVIARTNALDKAELQMMQKMVEAKNDEIKKLESQMQDGLLERKTLADELNKAQNDIKSNKSDLEALKKGDPGQVIKRLEEEKKTLRYLLGIFIRIPLYNLTNITTQTAQPRAPIPCGPPGIRGDQIPQDQAPNRQRPRHTASGKAEREWAQGGDAQRSGGHVGVVGEESSEGVGSAYGNCRRDERPRAQRNHQVCNADVAR